METLNRRLFLLWLSLPSSLPHLVAIIPLFFHFGHYCSASVRYAFKPNQSHALSTVLNIIILTNPPIILVYGNSSRPPPPSSSSLLSSSLSSSSSSVHSPSFDRFLLTSLFLTDPLAPPSFRLCFSSLLPPLPPSLRCFLISNEMYCMYNRSVVHLYTYENLSLIIRPRALLTPLCPLPSLFNENTSLTPRPSLSNSPRFRDLIFYFLFILFLSFSRFACLL